MLKLFACAALSYAAANVASASAVVLEPFGYSTGALLGDTNASTGNGWLRAGVSAAPTAIGVVAGSLTAPAPLQPATGNAVSLTGVGDNSGSSERLALPAPISSGTIYYSFSLRTDALTGSNNTIGGFFIGLNNTGNSSQTTNPTVVAAKIQSRIDPSDATKYDLGVFSNATATAGATSWSSGLNVGDTVFVVAAYTFNTTSATDDVASFWISPDVSTLGAEAAPSATATNTGGTDLAQIASLILRQSPAPYTTIDELRIGTSWADVTSVPEPTSVGLLSLGVAVGLSRHGRGRGSRTRG